MIIGVGVTKSVSFRGADQEFTNVYHYKNPTAVTAPFAAIRDEIVNVERNLHSSDVSFRRIAIWSAGASAAENEMLFQEPLTGTGNQVLDGSLDRERAVLVQWPAGKSITGKPVFLRKWYHPCGACREVTWTDAQKQNTAPIAELSRDQIANEADTLSDVGGTEAWTLCAPSGRSGQGPPGVHPYLEHHQLGDQWR